MIYQFLGEWIHSQGTQLLLSFVSLSKRILQKRGKKMTFQEKISFLFEKWLGSDKSFPFCRNGGKSTKSVHSLYTDLFDFDFFHFIYWLHQNMYSQ